MKTPMTQFISKVVIPSIATIQYVRRFENLNWLILKIKKNLIQNFTGQIIECKKITKNKENKKQKIRLSKKKKIKIMIINL